MFFNFAFKFRLVNENFSTVQKIIELIFSLFPFDAIVVYPKANYRKKVHGVVLVYVLLSRLPTFCVFNVVVNHSIFVVKGLNPGVSCLSNESALQSTVIVRLRFDRASLYLACSRRSDSGKRCEVKRSAKK